MNLINFVRKFWIPAIVGWTVICLVYFANALWITSDVDRFISWWVGTIVAVVVAYATHVYISGR